MRHIQEFELEQIARRVWYAKRDRASRVNCGEEKHARFESMGFSGMSTEFPMCSGEWRQVGTLEISVSYPKWDVPALIRVRKASSESRVCVNETGLPENERISYMPGTLTLAPEGAREGMIASGTGLGYYVLPPHPELRWSDAYSRQYLGTEKECYVLTHLVSGCSFGVWFWSEREVRGCLERIALLTNWFQTYQQLRARPARFDTLQGQVSYIIRASGASYAIPHVDTPGACLVTTPLQARIYRLREKLMACTTAQRCVHPCTDVPSAYDAVFKEYSVCLPIRPYQAAFLQKLLLGSLSETTTRIDDVRVWLDQQVVTYTEMIARREEEYRGAAVPQTKQKEVE